MKYYWLDLYQQFSIELSLKLLDTLSRNSWNTESRLRDISWKSVSSVVVASDILTSFEEVENLSYISNKSGRWTIVFPNLSIHSTVSVETNFSTSNGSKSFEFLANQISVKPVPSLFYWSQHCSKSTVMRTHVTEIQ